LSEDAALSSPAILVENLTKSFGSTVALAGVDFEVPPGTIFGLLGPNGAGKTTTVRILATVLSPDGGRCEVMGHDVAGQPAEVRRRIGLAGQSAAVDPNLTGRENLRMIGELAQLPRKDVAPRGQVLLDRFDLASAADRPVRTYSGGMRRRLDVAAALVHRPPVIFLDEPTTGLDVSSRTELWTVIRELVAEGATVLLTTQYLEEADVLADRIAVVSNGRVVANDTAAALKARLGSTVVEIGMVNAQDADWAEKVLSARAGDHLDRDGMVLHLTSNDGPRALMEVLRSLDAENLEPATLAVREPSLDDVFLALTSEDPPQPAMAAPSADGGE